MRVAVVVAPSLVGFGVGVWEQAGGEGGGQGKPGQERKESSAPVLPERMDISASLARVPQRHPGGSQLPDGDDHAEGVEGLLVGDEPGKTGGTGHHVRTGHREQQRRNGGP